MPKKISRKKLEEQLKQLQLRQKRICAVVLCHEETVALVGDLYLCEEHKDCMPLLPFGFTPEVQK